MLIGRDLEPDDYLFPARTSPRWLTKDKGMDVQPFERQQLVPKKPMTHPARVVQKGLRLMGYTDEEIKGEGIHLLRRSAARQFYEFSLSQGHESAIRAVQAFLDHKNTATTEHYLGLNADRQKRNAILENDFLPFTSNVVHLRNVG